MLFFRALKIAIEASICAHTCQERRYNLLVFYKVKVICLKIILLDRFFFLDFIIPIDIPIIYNNIIYLLV